MMTRALTAALVCLAGSACAQSDFVNWETPHVHPIDLGVAPMAGPQLLAAVNTADNRVEVFEVTDAGLRHARSVPVGLDPVGVRFAGESIAWVANHVSDTVSVVNLRTGELLQTIDTDDEPCDVVFTTSPRRAFVTCSQANTVQVFNPMTGVLTQTIELEAEDPRALAVSPDGGTVYAAIFESFNDTTILGGGSTGGIAFPPNVVNSNQTPYNGQNPPPNDGNLFSPAVNPANPTPLRVGMIVRKHDAGQWTDDNGGDWTDLVSGPNANASGRMPGWDMVDHDVAIIDNATLSLSYQTGLMNAVMAIGVEPNSGEVTVVGTEATNEIRFEPNLNGRFVRIHAAAFPPAGGSALIGDVNSHLTYMDGPVFVPEPQSVRDRSIGDPRAIVWTDDGRGFVAGMGSNNITEIGLGLSRAGTADTIEVGQGPTGIAVDNGRDRLYVINKFDASISIIDTTSESVVGTVAFPDPTPIAISEGRPFLYDTHLTSGLGQASCASCHIDARMDRLAWDLGDPSGSMKAFDQNCLLGGCQDWHPMKGPMTTQTFQDIIEKEPHHWRADRAGIEQFNPAFESILGDDTQLTAQEMQQFEDFLATIHFPPNPYRSIDNTLPTALPLDGHFTTGRFAPAGQPLPDGNAQIGLDLYRFGGLDGIECVTCHTLPTGMGTGLALTGVSFVPIPDGPNGEKHLAIVSQDGSTNVSIKIPQLRNMHEKGGFNTTQQRNTAGFGFLHDGSVDSIERFLAEPVFSLGSVQELADLTAFMLSFAGSELPNATGTLLEPPGPPSLDTHAAVGKQVTLPTSDPELLNRLSTLLTLADANRIGLVVKGRFAGEDRGYTYAGMDLYQSDRAIDTPLHADLVAAANQDGAVITFTAVPLGSETRIGIDRDRDGFLDTDELDACADPANAMSTPNNSVCCVADTNGDGSLSPADFNAWILAFNTQSPACDQNGDGLCTAADFNAWILNFNSGCP